MLCPRLVFKNYPFSHRLDPCRGPKQARLSTGPYQPRSNALRKGQFPKRKIGQRERSFSDNWYNRYVWIEYSPSLDAAFCHYCRLFASHKPGCCESAFIDRGYRNWKMASTDFKKHEESKVHKTAVSQYVDAKRMQERGDSISQQLSRAYNSEVRVNRRNVKRIFEIILLFGRQGIAYRGHDESDSSLNRGNLLEFLHYKARECPELATHLAGSVHYTSPKIQNDMISLIGKAIQQNIVDEVKKAGVFAIIGDETMDVSRLEQMSVCVRYVTNDFVINERFLGFWSTPTTDGATLFALLTDTLLSLGLSLNQVRAQCYDGASNMRGRYSGLAARVQEVENRAVYIHCHAHQLNLALQTACCAVKDIRNVLGTVSSLYNFLEGSAKRHAKLAEVQHSSVTNSSSNHPVITLKRLCETRWSSRYRSVQAVLSNYSAILETLTFVSENDTSKSGADAHSLFLNVCTFHFFFYLTVLNALLEVTNVLSEYLQHEQINMREAKTVADSSVLTLEGFRTDEKFSNFWTEACKAMTDYDLQEPTLGRLRRPPRRLSEGSCSGDTFADAKQSFRVTYYELVDVLVEELKSRFKDQEVSVLISMEDIFVGAYSQMEPSEDSLQQVVLFYRSDIDERRLRNELMVFYTLVKQHASSVPRDPIVQLAQLLLQTGLSIFPQVAHLLRLYLLVPVSSCSAERSFSCLRRLKTWLRNTMGQNRLSSLSIMNIEREETIKLECDSGLESLLTKFNEMENRRLPLT